MSAESLKAQSLDSEILVIGAGLIGSSVAMHLARLGVSNVRVVDFDLEGTFSSSELNAGGVRATWSQAVNVLSSKLSIEYFEKNAEDVGYRACGYLWLHGKEKLAAALKARERQQALGWPVEAWDVATLRARIPFIDKTDDLAGAVFAPRDGLVNPNLLKKHFRAEARALGVQFEDRVWVRSSEMPANGKIHVEGLRFGKDLASDDKQLICTGREDTLPSAPITFRADRVVNCAGAWAAPVAEALGYVSPSQAIRRQACIFDCRDVDLTPYGMIVDSSGIYFHPEATNVLAGCASPGEPAGYNFHYDSESFFMERIWPVLAERATAFERLRHITGWAGLYEVSPDDSAIIGVAQGAPAGRVFEAHSFSGHGVMHCYAAGLGVAELIARGRYETLDLSELGGDRFSKQRAVHESAVI